MQALHCAFGVGAFLAPLVASRYVRVTPPGSEGAVGVVVAACGGSNSSSLNTGQLNATAALHEPDVRVPWWGVSVATLLCAMFFLREHCHGGAGGGRGGLALADAGGSSGGGGDGGDGDGDE